MHRLSARRERQHPQAGHLQRGAAIGRPGQVLAPPQHYLVAELHLFRAHGPRQLQQGIRIRPLLLHAGREQLGHGDAMEQGFQLGVELIEVRPQGGDFGDLGHGGRSILAQYGLQQLVQVVVVEGAQHGQHALQTHAAVAVGQRLIGEAQGIAHAAVGRLGQGQQGAGLERLTFLIQHPLQLLGDLALIQALEVELEAAGQDGDGELLRIRGGQQELHIGRRLFQGFEQRIEAVARQHVHLIDEVHLEAAAGRAVLHVVQQLAGVFHLGARGRIDLQQIDEVALIDLTAGVAYAARVAADPLLAVEALGQDAGDGGLADPAGAAQQVGMMQPSLIQGIGQGGQHMLLANHLFKRMGAPFTRQNLIAHRSRCWKTRH
ncbi:hypothetical protein D3C75_491900 [compost metagenome]